MSKITTPDNCQDCRFTEVLERLGRRIAKPTHIRQGTFRVYDAGGPYRAPQFREVEGLLVWLDLPDHGRAAHEAPKVLIEEDGRVWPMSGGWVRLPKYI